MRKAILVVALLALMLPAAAQDMGGCMIEPPESAAQINMIGWTYPINKGGSKNGNTTNTDTLR